MIIGIGGVSRAGKSTLANLLKKHIKGKTITILNQDDFVKKTGLPTIKKHIDWEHPDSLNWNQLYQTIILASKSNEIVIVEGLFAFHNKKILKMYDRLIFVNIGKNLFFTRKRKDLRWGREPDWFIDHIWESFLMFGQAPVTSTPVLIVKGDQKINL
ncbi:MAG: hypothetical protein ABI844_13690, partial [Saprospiraceae bacterium]